MQGSICRLYTQAAQGFARRGLLRQLATPAWPADVPVPEGGKPFDPKGSLIQVDELMVGLDEQDPWVDTIRKLKNLKLAHSKMESEWKAQAESLPAGVVLAGGKADPDFYVKSQGIHPKFVQELDKLMAEEAKRAPVPKADTAWKDAMTAMRPLVETEQQSVLKELEALRAKEQELADIQDRLEDVTVNEILDKYPDLAQEIKDEIEAGDWSMRDAGYKVGQTAVTA